MLKALKSGVAATALGLGLGSAALAQEEIAIAELSWDGARAIAYIMKEVLETRLDTEAEIKKAEAAVIFAGMDKGDGGLDVYPDVWMPNQQEKWAEYIEGNGTVLANSQPYLGTQALFIPKYVQEEHGITSIEDLKKPEVAELFDTDGDGLGEYWAGAPGWASTNEWEIKFKSYGLNDLWEPLVVDDAIFKGQLDAAYTREEPVIFYYWTPEWLHAAYELVPVEEPAYTEGCMNVFAPSEREDWLEASEFACANKDAEVWNAYSKSLEERNPEAACFLKNMTLEPETVNEWILKLGRDGMDAEDMAEEWVAENEEIVDQWLEGCTA